MEIKELSNLIDYKKLGEKMLLVDAPKPNFKYVNGKKTEEIGAYTYVLVLEEFGYEKIEVKIEGNIPLIKPEVFLPKQSIPIKVKDLQSNPYIGKNDGKFYYNFKASSISLNK
ncbi:MULTISPECIES: hypothetical protein [unclassified Lysinibacillus]|jgi:hypothetical protein|uniref:hypothetical protein n=1 Tax=unclassified Lysinibacillus TaxID=2636778 RepID=UPI00232B172B|nr:hypothetical protein [Lysinibacillus sp. OF-1]WCH47177.1 hypothetical protein NV349_19390 [Lysinibacillus sp. OF-1]